MSKVELFPYMKICRSFLGLTYKNRVLHKIEQWSTINKEHDQ